MKQLTNADKVRQFMVAMGQPVDQPLELTIDGEIRVTDLLDLRDRLIEEEVDEFQDAKTPADLLKELCDLLYVTYGFAITFGLDIDTAFERVHQSNLSKLGEDGKPIFREDGKVMKGPNYKPPVLEDLV